MRVNSLNCFYSQNAFCAENKNITVSAPVFKGELLNDTTNFISKSLVYSLGLIWICVGLIYEIGRETLGLNKE